MDQFVRKYLKFNFNLVELILKSRMEILVCLRQLTVTNGGSCTPELAAMYHIYHIYIYDIYI